MAVYLGSSEVGLNTAYNSGIIPSGTSTITENGIYNVTNFASASVNVSGSGFTVDDIAMRTISGDISGSATTIGSYAFHSCSALTAASFPNVTSIGSSAFGYCSALTAASFPNVTSIGDYAFYRCLSLTTVSFPNATSIGDYAFAYCRESLSAVSFPNVTSIKQRAFYSCNSLTTASFPSVASIGESAFYACYNLISLYLNSISAVPTLWGASTFFNTPIGGRTTSTGGVYGSVYVPASLYSSFLTAENWSSIAERIVSV